MTIHEASVFFESLMIKTTNKSEIEVYEKFIRILNKLNNREFTEAQIKFIETELDSLNVKANSEHRKKYIKNALNKFEAYLKDSFSLVSKGYYTNRGIGLGSSFGILFGIIVLSRFERSLGIALGLSIGMIIGFMIGRSMESQAKSAGRII